MPKVLIWESLTQVIILEIGSVTKEKTTVYQLCEKQDA